MKIILSVFLLTVTIQLAKAQNSNVTGSVQDENGRLLHFVAIEDSKYQNVAFTDSLGNFTIPVHPDSKLQFALEGYRDTLFTAGKISEAPQVILKSYAKVPVETFSLSLHPFTRADGLLVPVAQKPNQVGSRYMFDGFSHGFIVDASGKLVSNPYYLFDYEKVSGLLLLTVDKKNVKAVVKEQVKSFTIYNNTDELFNFEMVPAIDKMHYVQVLSTGKKYKICKLTKTKFVPADFQNTASGGAGNDYDEYVDDAEYYLFNVADNSVQKLALRKKAIKDDFSKEADKVNKFLTDNTGKIDDPYLSSLGDYMNK
jgi:hypothetical protein